MALEPTISAGERPQTYALDLTPTGTDLPQTAYLLFSTLSTSQLVSLKFFIDIKSFRSHYGPGVDSACNRNEHQEHFLGVKAAGA